MTPGALRPIGGAQLRWLPRRKGNQSGERGALALVGSPHVPQRWPKWGITGQLTRQQPRPCELPFDGRSAPDWPATGNLQGFTIRPEQ